MARATRSAASTTATTENDKPSQSPPASRKPAPKKRKRNSNAENGDSPPTKHARTNSKDDGTPELDPQPEHKDIVDLPSSGDVPIQAPDAANILEVLELVDNQGLLDRVFPLPAPSGESAAADSSSSTMLSFRSLLQNSSQYPLSVLRTAVQHLHPISSHPRSRPSEPAIQQLRFCNLALSLLDQASRKNAPISLATESLVAEEDSQEVDDASSQVSSSGLRPRKYALVQHLPTGDWWTSASSRSYPGSQGKDLKHLHTAKAELVSVFPTPSGSNVARKGTLGDYVKKPPVAAHYRPPPPRRVSCGKFLYYGPYASFAPCFDQDGVEVGRVAMGEVIFDQEMKRRLRALAKGKRRAFVGAREAAATAGDDVEMQDAAGEDAASTSEEKDLAKSIEALLSPEDVESIKASLGTLEMEQAVDELLQRNAKALQRLEELQHVRWREHGSGSSVVEVGSEEWDVAQGIIDSLVILASLRPRPSNGDSDESPLVPPPSVLHKLQRTLPIDATEGWYGTLFEGRTTAFRDDTTVHVRASAVAAAASSKAATAAAAPSTPGPKTTAPAPATASTPYTPYNYQSNYQGAQYRGGYGTYAPSGGNSTSSSYYPNYGSTATAAAQPAAAQTGTASSHYPNAQYGTAGQGQYAYSSWYGGYQNPAAATTTPGRATPQPSATQPAGYGGYYPSTQQPAVAAGQRAVANTVASSAKPAYQAGTWNGAAGAGTTGYAPPPTLPPHMRSAAAPASPSPAPASTGGYGGYYGGYQAPR
ncbi:hypothetical protein BD413DRAFT_486479 [Trametes elegans]|nr:hypothetical protein BD413DRAFT_486479 [Trametes elegans]